LKAESFAWRDFKEEVFPFLDERLMTLYADAGAFEALRVRVVGALSAMAS
jgi:hypothetical protein